MQHCKFADNIEIRDLLSSFHIKLKYFFLLINGFCAKYIRPRMIVNRISKNLFGTAVSFSDSMLYPSNQLVFFWEQVP